MARQGSGDPAEVPADVPLELHPAGDDVVVKKRALKWVKQQVSALLHGEDLPEGAEAREVAEVPYQIPAVPGEAKDCPVCQQSFVTHHRLMVHMGCTKGRSTHVISVGRCWPIRKCGEGIPLPVFMVRKWHVQTVVSSMKIPRV